MKFWIYKKVKNGMNVFQGNKHYNKNGHYTSDLNQAWFFTDELKALSKMDKLNAFSDGFDIVGENKVKGLLLENVETQITALRFK